MEKSKRQSEDWENIDSNDTLYPEFSRVLYDELFVVGADASEQFACRPEKERLFYRHACLVGSLIEVMTRLRSVAESGAKERRDDFYDSALNPFPLAWSKVYSVLDLKDAPETIITQIAQRYRPDLLDLLLEPRKILQRTRKKTPLSQIQQVDMRCLAWMTQQPGRSFAQKAGSSQKILAVTRYESYNTLENRVLGEFLRLCHRESCVYVRRHRDDWHLKERFKATHRFQKETKSILLDGKWLSMPRLTSIPQPNYVLQFDRRYRGMWTWYLKIVGSEQELERVWNNQHKLFAEFCRLAVAAAVCQSPGLRPMFGHDLWILPMQENGCWLESRDWPATFVFRDQWVIDFINKEHPRFRIADVGQQITIRVQCLAHLPNTVYCLAVFVRFLGNNVSSSDVQRSFDKSCNMANAIGMDVLYLFNQTMEKAPSLSQTHNNHVLAIKTADLGVTPIAQAVTRYLERVLR